MVPSPGPRAGWPARDHSRFPTPGDESRDHAPPDPCLGIDPQPAAGE